MANYLRIKKYLSVIGFTILILSVESCNNSGDSNSTQNAKSEEANIVKKEETTTESTQKKAFNRDSENDAANIPTGYELFEKIQGDLNGDGVEDYVLIIKGTDQQQIITNDLDEEVDRNRRGILVYLTQNNQAYLTSQNLSCFSSENEDGGGYFPPELSISIENGKLYIHYSHGRYGHWKYTFRFQVANFELIEYDASDNYGPIVNTETSINFLTKKKLTRENVNVDAENSGDEVFEESWEEIDLQLLKLSEINDFDELDM